MATSDEIKRKALELSEKTDSNSISPKEVGGIMHDLASLGENAIRNGGTLGIRKVYTSVSVMEADKNPKDFWGNPMKKGNLVLIYDGTTTGLDNNKIYVYMNPGWEFATYLDAGYPTRQEFSELGSKVDGEKSIVQDINVGSFNKVGSGIPYLIDISSLEYGKDYNLSFVVDGLSSANRVDVYFVKGNDPIVNIISEKNVTIGQEISVNFQRMEGYNNIGIHDFIVEGTGIAASNVKITHIEYNGGIIRDVEVLNEKMKKNSSDVKIIDKIINGDEVNITDMELPSFDNTSASLPYIINTSELMFGVDYLLTFTVDGFQADSAMVTIGYCDGYTLKETLMTYKSLKVGQKIELPFRRSSSYTRLGIHDFTITGKGIAASNVKITHMEIINSLVAKTEENTRKVESCEKTNEYIIDEFFDDVKTFTTLGAENKSINYSFKKNEQYLVTVNASPKSGVIYFYSGSEYLFAIRQGDSYLWTPRKDYSSLDYGVSGASEVVLTHENSQLTAMSKRVFYCGKDRELKTLREGLNAATSYMNSVLYVDDGTYDLIEEFGSEWFESLDENSGAYAGLQLKNRVHIVFSPNSKVVSHYNGENQYVKSLYSPFNVDMFGFTVENLTLECSNCRYGIHDDMRGDTRLTIHKYKNCNLKLDNSQNTSWNSKAVIGGGLSSNSIVDIHDCIFDGSVYYHQSASMSNSNFKSVVNIKNSYFKTNTVRLDFNRDDAVENTVVNISGCSFKKIDTAASDGIIYRGGGYTDKDLAKTDVYVWNNEIRD